MSCQLTAVLWRQIALRNRGYLSSGCHQLFIPLSLSTQTLHHLPTGLMVVVLWTITHTTHLLHTSAHMYRNIQTNIPVKLLPPLFLSLPLPPHPPPPPTPEPSVMKTRCFYSPRTEGSSSAAQVKAPTPLLTVDAL